MAHYDETKNRFNPENRFVGDIENGKRYPFGCYTKEESDERYASKSEEETIQQIDERVTELEYVPISIVSFSAETTICEIGSVNTILLSWGLNRTASHQELNGFPVEGNTAECQGVSSTTLYTLSVTDGKSSAQSTIEIEFANQIYYGATSDLSSIELTLNKTLSNEKKRNFETTATDGQYIVYAIPKRLGRAIVYMNSFEDQFDISEQILSNESGYQELYNVYISKQTGVGTASIEVAEEGDIEEKNLSNSLKLKSIKESVTPEMFGAVGDGETDDTAAIQAAAQFCKNNHRPLYMRNTTYKITDTIIFEAINVVSDGKIVNYANKPCIKIINSLRCQFTFNEIISSETMYTAISGSSVNYSIGILIQNSTDCKITATRIYRFVSGIAMLSTESRGVYYNVINVKSFETCFNGIRLIAADSVDSVNGNVIEYAKFDFHTWNTEDKPYCIIIDSFASEGGTPYKNNTNYFDNLYVEYGVNSAKYPRLVKADYGNNNFFDFRRIEIYYKEEGTNNLSDCFEYGAGVNNFIAHIEFSWRRIVFDNRNANGNRVKFENGVFGVIGPTGNRFIDLSDTLETDVPGLDLENKEMILDTETGLVVLSLVFRCRATIAESNTPMVRNILPLKKEAKIIEVPSSKETLWAKPTESVALFISNQTNVIANVHRIEYDTHFAINLTYYTTV